MYIVYEINTWPCNPSNNFMLKYCLFSTVELTRKADKSKFTYNGRGKASAGKYYWGFDNDTARNVIIFDVDNSSSSYIDNPKKLLMVVLMVVLVQQ